MSVRLVRRYGDADLAERVLAAVSVDDPGSVRMARTGDEVVLEVDGSNPATVRATLDDLIACLGAAEATAGLVKRSRR